MVQKIKGSRQIQSGTITPTELEATAITPGVYGDAANIPVLTIDADGRITAASEVAGSGAALSDGDKGDVTVSGSGAVWTVDNNVVTNAKAADMATDTIKGRATAGTGDPEDLTSLPFAFTGDVTRPADSNVQTIPNDTVTYAKMQNVSAASRLLGRGSAAGSGDVQEMTVGAGLSISGTELASTGGASVLDVNLTEVGNVGVGEDNLITYSVAGNTLSVNEEYLHFIASGIFAASINNKRLRAYLGATLLFDSGTLAITAATDWILEGWIVREGQSVQKCSTKLNTSSATLAAYVDYVGATEDLATTLTLKLTGEATADNDIVQETLVVDKGGGAAGGGGGSFPEQATLWSDEFTYTTGAGAITLNVHASQIYQEFIQTSTPANGNAVSGKFFIKAGTYTLRLLTLTGSYLPIYDFYVDGSLVLAGMDCYAASDTFNVVKTGAVTIATDGQHTLEVRVNGKNASSTNYYIQFTKIWIS